MRSVVGLKPLADLAQERSRILDQIRLVASATKRIVEPEISDINQGIRLLESLRRKTYELINQLQHEALILEAASHLARADFAGKAICWAWNPRQTGSRDEPDLRGKLSGQVVVSAEVTTSRLPRGTIGTRMARTLEKLSQFPGTKVYYVRTEQMQRRAQTKIARAGYDIEVRVLCGDELA